jgi:transcriptional regulator with GAF, ATPase, and Fis domain
MRTQNLNSRSHNMTNGYLTLVGENVRKTFEVTDFTTIGRDPAAKIALADEYSSLRHARIEKREDGFYIRDTRSRNGTFLNGSRVLEAKLQDHDRILIGETEFVFTAEKDQGLSTTFITSLNAEWDKQLKRVPAIAQSQHPVLLLGPSGTGKEVLAQTLHRLSLRAKGPLINMNCSALTEQLAESELFGHVKGSFTGANTDRKGAFEAARGGTLFLDEIGDLPMTIQPKLLRALENAEIKPVGSDSSRSSDVRIIAATNQNLFERVQLGLFREDLYFRLNVLKILLPPLKDRMEDFDNLLQYFARPLKVYFTIEALTFLKAYNWPGQIRELRNAVSRASALYTGRPIGQKEVTTLIDPVPVQKEERPKSGPHLARQMIRDYERNAIIEKLKVHQGNQRRAAEELDMPKSTLNDRIRRYGIDVNNL